MSGAYTAKPAEIPPIQHPPGWNPVWPIGPPPPGFNPGGIGMYLYADAEIAIGGVTNAVKALMIGGPGPAGVLTFTASVNGSLRQLRMASGNTLLDSLLVNYGSPNNYTYTFSPSLYFDIQPEDLGKTLVLSIDGSPYGNDLNALASIKIIKPKIIVVNPTSISVSSKHPGSFAVQLTESPDKGCTVKVGVASNAPAEGTASVTSLTLSKTPKTVRVTWHDDGHGSVNPYKIIIGAAVSDDLAYNNQKPSDVSVNSNWKIVYTVTWSGTGSSGNTGIFLKSNPDNDFGVVDTVWPPGEVLVIVSDSIKYVGSGSGSTGIVTSQNMSGIYILEFAGGAIDEHGHSLACTATMSAKFYKSDVLQSESDNVYVSGSSFDIYWLQFDSSTGTITVLNQLQS